MKNVKSFMQFLICLILTAFLNILCHLKSITSFTNNKNEIIIIIIIIIIINTLLNSRIHSIFLRVQIKNLSQTLGNSLNSEEYRLGEIHKIHI